MYKLFKSAYTNEIAGVVKTEGEIVTCIPANPDNTDYQAYLKWLSEGNTPEPAEGTE